MPLSSIRSSLTLCLQYSSHFQKGPSSLFINIQRSYANSSAGLKYKTQMSMKDCCSILDVDADCTEEELRVAYLEKVKVYHPDRKTETSNAGLFAKVQEAYKAALNYKRGQALLEEEEKKKVDIEDIKHTVPQHRRYLTFNDVGFGSPSQRERQFKQFRVAQAAESVFEHRKLKHGSDESSIVTRDKNEARKIKISNLIDRVVDDMIRESMQRGDFDNLSGRGKPLDHRDHNPFIDTTTHNVNKILVNNGFKPEWIMLAKEIRDDMKAAREKLAVIREKLGPPPYDDHAQSMWEFYTDKFHENLKDINLKINRYNFIVPFMEKQMVHYDVVKNIHKIQDNHTGFLPIDEQGRPIDASQLEPFPEIKEENIRIRWGEVWSNIKEVFRSR